MGIGFFTAVSMMALGDPFALGLAPPLPPRLDKPEATTQLPAPAARQAAPNPAGPTDPLAAPVRDPHGACGDGCDGSAACACPAGEEDPWGGSGRFSFSADYLLWWVRKGPTGGPLLTRGSPDDAIPGALGQPGTVPLFGDGGLNYHTFSGLRLGGSVGLTPGLALEGNYFVLERRSDVFSAASDAAGSPLLARPVINDQAGLQESYSTSFPGLFAGRSDVASHSQLQGYEINLAATLARSEVRRLDVLVGYRYLNLREDLLFRDTLTPLDVGVLTFEGGPADPPSTVTDFDGFRTRNHFYGGQFGGRWQRTFGALDLGVTGKVALGVNEQRVEIDGASVLSTPGVGSVAVPGGILAQTSNIGTHSHSAFSVVPELGVNVGWQITPSLSANVGYTFLYWSEVVRPGAQIDRRVNPALVPTDQDFGNGLGMSRPAFGFHASDFWAQGLNFGVLLRF